MAPAVFKTSPGGAPAPPDLSNPSLRSWMAGLPQGTGRCASFETRIWWSPRGATKTITQMLGEHGYQTLGAERFIVTGKFGPLREGELERARRWGAELAREVAGETGPAGASA